MLLKIRKINGWVEFGSFDEIHYQDTPENIESVPEQIRLFEMADVIVEYQYKVRVSPGHVIRCTFNEMLENYGFYPINTVRIVKYGADKKHVIYERTISFIGITFIMNDEGKTIECIPAVSFLTADPNEIKEGRKKAVVTAK